MSRDEDERDRAAILARRKRFIALAIAGISGGCKQTSSAVSPVPAQLERRCAEGPSSVALRVEPWKDPACELGLEPLLELEPPPERLDDEQRSARVRSRYEAGREAFDAGRYDDALVAWRAAYAMSPDSSALLLLSADAARRGHRYAGARELYEAYLALPELDLTSEDALEARARLEQLARVCASRPSPCLEIPPPCSEPPPRSNKRGRGR